MRVRPAHLRRILGICLATAMGSALTIAGLVHAQTGAQPPAPSPQGQQAWQIGVDNISPDGHTWGFDTFYPDRIQAHPGDTVNWTVALNPNAFHTVTLAPAGQTPGTAFGGFVSQDPDDTSKTIFPFFAGEPTMPCGRTNQPPCSFDGTTAMNSGALVPPPPPEAGGGQGNLTFTATLSSRLAPGTYYFFCSVHGPTMSGSIDVLPPAVRAASAASLQKDAQTQYQADLVSLAKDGLAIQTPTTTANADGTTTWGTTAGGGTDSRLSIDEFGVHGLIIKAGDSVKWTMASAVPGEIHTVTGFATSPTQQPPELDAFDVACGGAGGVDTFPAGSGFPFDIWNTCWGKEESHATQYAMPNLPSGSAYSSGNVTSGILIPSAVAASPEIPFVSTYSLSFPTAGTYVYTCTVHQGMEGEITVLPK